MVARRRAARLLALRRRPGHVSAAALDRRRLHRPLRRSRTPLRQARATARRRPRLAGSQVRWNVREARAVERSAEPRADSRDRRGAHDRHRARHVRLGARERDEDLEPRGHRGSGRRRLPRHVGRRLLGRRRGRCRRGRGSPGDASRHGRPLRDRQGRRVGHVRDRHRPDADRTGVSLRVEGRLECGAREPGAERRDRRRRLCDGQAARAGGHLPAPDSVGRAPRARGARNLRAAALLPDAREREHPAGDVRLALRAPSQPVHARERRG